MSYSDPQLLKGRPAWFVQTIADLERHEGFREYAYPDPKSRLFLRHPRARWGFKPAPIIMAELGETGNENHGRPWTVGYGFTHNVKPNTRTTRAQSVQRLDAELLEHVKGLDTLVPTWRTMPLFAQTVLANMIYNMGTASLAKFAPTLTQFTAGRWFRAARRLQNTLWYKQVGTRAVELTERLINQKIADKHLVVKQHTIDTGTQCKYIGE